MGAENVWRNACEINMQEGEKDRFGRRRADLVHLTNPTDPTVRSGAGRSLHGLGPLISPGSVGYESHPGRSHSLA